MLSTLNLEHTTANKRSAKRHLVRIFQISPRGKAARWARDCHAQWRQEAMQIRRRRLAREIEICGDDDLVGTVALHTVDKLADLELIGPNAFDR